MVPSEVEIEARLAELRRRRDALDREIADHLLYLELGRRLRRGAALTVVLAQRTRGSGVLVNAADPGVVGTRMAPYASRTPDQAAEHIAALAMLADDGPSGRFWHEGHEEEW